MPGSQTPTVSYSPEFKARARETISAIERLQDFSGTLPKYEARKALDALSDVKSIESVSESNAYFIVMDYMYAIERYKITEAKKELDALTKARAAILVLDGNLR